MVASSAMPPRAALVVVAVTAACATAPPRPRLGVGVVVTGTAVARDRTLAAAATVDLDGLALAPVALPVAPSAPPPSSSVLAVATARAAYLERGDFETCTAALREVEVPELLAAGARELAARVLVWRTACAFGRLAPAEATDHAAALAGFGLALPDDAGAVTPDVEAILVAALDRAGAAARLTVEVDGRAGARLTIDGRPAECALPCTVALAPGGPRRRGDRRRRGAGVAGDPGAGRGAGDDPPGARSPGPGPGAVARARRARPAPRRRRRPGAPRAGRGRAPPRVPRRRRAAARRPGRRRAGQGARRPGARRGRRLGPRSHHPRRARAGAAAVASARGSGARSAWRRPPRRRSPPRSSSSRRSAPRWASDGDAPTRRARGERALRGRLPARPSRATLARARRGDPDPRLPVRGRRRCAAGRARVRRRPAPASTWWSS
jgi:hypothetical protein